MSAILLRVKSDVICAKTGITLTFTFFLQMFEKGSDVKQGNVTETKFGPQCPLSAKNHVQMARELQDLNMDLRRLRSVFK